MTPVPQRGLNSPPGGHSVFWSPLIRDLHGDGEQESLGICGRGGDDPLGLHPRLVQSRPKERHLVRTNSLNIIGGVRVLIQHASHTSVAT